MFPSQEVSWNGVVPARRGVGPSRRGAVPSREGAFPSHSVLRSRASVFPSLIEFYCVEWYYASSSLFDLDILSEDYSCIE